MLRSRTASSADVPNLRDSGNRLWESSTSSRTYTAEPGAAAASLWSSPSESSANRQTPRATACRMCCSGFTVLLNRTSFARTPTASRGSSSYTEAISKPAPRSARVASTGSAALHLSAKYGRMPGIARVNASKRARDLRTVGGEERRVEADLVQRIGLEPCRPGLPTRRTRLKQIVLAQDAAIGTADRDS